jgi:hypothetical protein
LVANDVLGIGHAFASAPRPFFDELSDVKNEVAESSVRMNPRLRSSFQILIVPVFPVWTIAVKNAYDSTQYGKRSAAA